MSFILNKGISHDICKTTIGISSVLLFSLAVSYPLHAAEFTLGLAGYYAKPAYQDFKDNAGAFPLIEYQGDRWSAGTAGVSVKFYQSEQSSLFISLALGSVGQGFGESDSSVFNGMPKRKRGECQLPNGRWSY